MEINPPTTARGCLQQQVETRMGNKSLRVTMSDIHPRKLQSVYSPSTLPESRETNWRIKQPSQASCVLKELEC